MFLYRDTNLVYTVKGGFKVRKDGSSRKIVAKSFRES